MNNYGMARIAVSCDTLSAFVSGAVRHGPGFSVPSPVTENHKTCAMIEWGVRVSRTFGMSMGLCKEFG